MKSGSNGNPRAPRHRAGPGSRLSREHDLRGSANGESAAASEPIEELLTRIAAGELSVAEAMKSLALLPFEDLGFATVDHHRALRKGCPEVVYCAGKTAQQVAAIVDRLSRANPRVLGTRASPQRRRYVLRSRMTSRSTAR